MSHIFRTIAATSRTLSQALAPAAVLILALVIYTGFVIPTRDMLGWSRWMNYLDPIGYGFSALMVRPVRSFSFLTSTDMLVNGRSTSSTAASSRAPPSSPRTRTRQAWNAFARLSVL